MHNAERLAFTTGHSAFGEASLLPLLPITLTYQEHSTQASGLLDTGATVNVLPYHIGVELGAVWNQQTTVVRLGGNLARSEARLLLVLGVVGRFDPVRLAFAWTQAEHVPLILGQVNFFMEFDLTIRAIDYANREFGAVGDGVSVENACPAPILPDFQRNGLHQSNAVSAEWEST